MKSLVEYEDGHATRVLLEHSPGTHFDRTTKLARLAQAEHYPPAIRDLYARLGDLFPPEGGETAAHVRLATEKQLRYISFLAGLDLDTFELFRNTARCHGLDRAQAGHLIGELLAASGGDAAA